MSHRLYGITLLAGQGFFRIVPPYSHRLVVQRQRYNIFTFIYLYFFRNVTYFDLRLYMFRPYAAIVKYVSELNSVALVRERIYRLNDRRLSAKLVPTFADRG
jgi:hypothetical protein